MCKPTLLMGATRTREWFAVDLPTNIPSLDGLRALSIAFVLFAHCIGTRRFPIAHSEIMGTAGLFGVRIFFVISGFLITTILLREYCGCGAISLRDFYVRRFLRIFPAFYAYLIFIGIVVVSGYGKVLSGDFLHAVSYTMNYHAPHGWLMGHLWSLSVEEQFYLVWPALVAFAGPGRAIWVAASTVVAVPLLRFGSLQFLRIDSEFFGMQFHLCCDALAIGCVLAISHSWLGTQEWYISLLRGRAFVLIPACSVLLNALTEHPRALGLAGYTVMNIGIALSIDRLVRFPPAAIGKILNSRPVRFVGVLSYSLYLWQQFFLNRGGHHWINTFPVNVAAAGIAAVLSYYVVERPFLRLKGRFAPATIGSRTLHRHARL